jgi:succinate dehydrogenase hydrophobic anchor subunit
MDKEEVDRKLEVLMKLHEVNYDYQNQKDQMVWLGSSVYLSFSAAAVVWFLSKPEILSGHSRKLVFDVLMFFLSVVAFIFVCFHNWNKAWSVERDYFLKDKIKTFDTGEIPSYKQIVDAAYPNWKPSCRQKWYLSWKNGKSGILILAVMALFFMVVGIIPWCIR